jgi:predicted hydrolase (HD superfamily)
MTREDAITILSDNLKNKNMAKHCLASGAVTDGLAKKLLDNPSEDEILAWELAGILHDADAESSPEKDHGAMVGQWFEKGGKYKGQLPEKYKNQIIHAMAAHNEMTGVKCESPMDWALYAGEKLTGLIVATTLVLPSKKLADVDTDMVLRRFKEKSFAKGAKRENIIQCEKTGLELRNFVEVCLRSMQSISKELGL